MASNNGIPEKDFRFLKITVSEYFDARGLLVMLKVLFKDHVKESKLSGITKTIELLNALESSGAFSYQDLTLLHDAIKLTDEFSLETELKGKIPSFPLVDKQTPFTKFTAYRQKLLKFGHCLASNDVSKIDASCNTPLKNYTDSWAMIRDLEHKQVITPTKMADFIKELGRIDLKAAVSILNEGFTPECQKETEHSTNARPIYNLPESEYLQLLVNVSKRWQEFGKIHMLKVLLCDFNRIGITEIQKEDDVFNLFNLLRGSGKLSPSNIDVIAEAAFLCGVGPIEEIIKKKIPTYQYPASMDEVHKISKYRRNVIEFGFKVEETNLETILKLCGLSHIKETDKWRLILSLELNNKLTPKTKETFVKMLRENGMIAEVDALNTY
ncbi:uncharacterized protein [Antedon mediterranea]|uniref:uncharacterized protein n=1 Tax=Antedon mediterranea TaxID=105859 RepID=UPI003AF42E21